MPNVIITRKNMIHRLQRPMYCTRASCCIICPHFSLTNRRDRFIKLLINGLLVPLENMGTHACLSSPDLVDKLHALFDIRYDRKTIGALRMLSVVFDATVESRPGAWTDVLAAVTRFSHLEYLEVCVTNDFERTVFNVTRPDDHPRGKIFHVLPHLLSLSIHVQRIEHFNDGGEWSLFAETATRTAKVQHLLLLADNISIDTLLGMHAAHLVSLRTIYALGSGQVFPCLKFLRLFNLPLEYASSSALFEQCPALEVLWCAKEYTEDPGRILTEATASSHLHTLIVHTMGYSDRDVPLNPKMRHLYIQCNESSYDGSVSFQFLLHALPNLHTYVVSTSDQLDDEDGDVLVDAGKGTNQLRQLQPFCARSETGKISLVLPARITSHTQIYAPTAYITQTAQDSTEDADNRVHPMPSWKTWKSHIGTQLIKAGLSILSPCGSCSDRRTGMFDRSRTGIARQRPSASTSASSASSTAKS
jgi:hypothetical protein